MAREIRVNGGQSDWYKEAIFILKEDMQNDVRPKNLVEYADQIVEKHMKLGTVKKTSKSIKQPTNQQKWIDYFFWGSISFLGIVCILYFIV